MTQGFLAGTSPLDVSVHTWEARNGTSVLVRPIEPGDFERERDFVNGLSPQTGYQRLMNPRKPSTAELERWTRVDRAHEGVLVATVSEGGPEQQIGVARYAMESEDGEAEFAIVIADAWQGTGVGHHLLASLIELARQSGVRRVFGTTLSENRAMLGLARRLGFRQSRVPGAAIYTMLTLALQPEA
ncbi:hypothetical protein A8M77_04740 [Variovorax sp. JS1663]|nr:hypothetical protein A8M77_04740 [Variovorax sp. JS1663]